jgi:hypothetical protein
VQDVAGPPVAEPGDVGQLVRQAGREHQSPCRDAPPVGEEGPEPVCAVGQQIGDDAVDDFPAVSADLVTACGQQLGGWHAVAGEVAVHVGGGCVAWLTGIDHQDPAASPGQDQGGGQASGASANDYYVVSLHVSRLEAAVAHTNECCRFWETGVR